MYQQRALSRAGATGTVCRHCLCGRPVVRPVCRRTRDLYVCQASRSNPGSFTQGKTHSQQGGSDSRNKETIQERAQAVGQVASQRVKQTYQAVEGGIKQAARNVNSRFDLKGKAQQTKDRVVQQLEDVDDKFQLRQKARVTLADAQRQLPRWRRQYGAFSKTLPGRVLWFAFLVWGFRSGLFFKLLNLAGLLLLLAPLVIVPLAQALTSRAAAAQAAQQAQQMKQQQQAQSPFSKFGEFVHMRAQQRQQQSTGKKSSYAQQDGPVIDAEWTTIDEGDQ